MFHVFVHIIFKMSAGDMLPSKNCRHLSKNTTARLADLWFRLNCVRTMDNKGAALTRTAHAGAQEMTSNYGERDRVRLFNGGAVVRVIDTLNTVCFNKNGTYKIYLQTLTFNWFFTNTKELNTFAGIISGYHIWNPDNFFASKAVFTLKIPPKLTDIQ